MKKSFVLFLVKLGYSKLTPLQKANKARSIVLLMTGNADFPTPIPALASVTTAAAAVEQAESELDGTKLKTLQRDIVVAELNALMSQLQSYVNTTANGDRAKVLSTGFEARNAPSPSTHAGPVTQLTVKSTLVEGQAELKWKPEPKSKINVVSFSNDLITWDLKGETTKSKIVLDNLKSGSITHFRVACINSAGIGDWSEMVSCKIL